MHLGDHNGLDDYQTKHLCAVISHLMQVIDLHQREKELHQREKELQRDRADQRETEAQRYYEQWVKEESNRQLCKNCKAELEEW